jgi:hypothetical protein
LSTRPPHSTAAVHLGASRPPSPSPWYGMPHLWIKRPARWPWLTPTDGRCSGATCAVTRRSPGRVLPYWSPQDLPGAAAVERSVNVAPVPVEELHPDQVGMRLAPRRPHDWSQVELDGRFLDRRVYFLTWDGQRVEAEIVGFGALSDELYLARAVHAPGPGPSVSLWIPAWDAYCWANPESLIVCDPLSEAALPSRL